MLRVLHFSFYSSTLYLLSVMVYLYTFIYVMFYFFSILELFFELFSCQDKALRMVKLYTYVNDSCLSCFSYFAVVVQSHCVRYQKG